MWWKLLSAYSFLGISLRAWLLCVDGSLIKERKGLVTFLGGRSRSKLVQLFTFPQAEWRDMTAPTLSYTL